MEKQEIISKECSKCGTLKLLKEFHLHPLGKYGRNYKCKLCANRYAGLYRKANLEKTHEANRLWKITNSVKVKEYARHYRKRNAEKAKEYFRLYKITNSEKYYKQQQKWNKKRRGTITGKLNHSMATGIYASLCGNKDGRSWETLAGYTLKQLKKHLEKKMLPNMSWENYGQWHIDHKIPISAFNFEKPEDIDFKKCWSLKNLQPLWKKDNLVKHAKLNKPFQPSLTI